MSCDTLNMYHVSVTQGVKGVVAFEGVIYARASIEDWLSVKKTMFLLLAIVVRSVAALVIAVSSA